MSSSIYFKCLISGCLLFYCSTRSKRVNTFFDAGFISCFYNTGAPRKRAYLVRRLFSPQLLPKEPAHRRDPHRHAVPLPLLARERSARLHQGTT